MYCQHCGAGVSKNAHFCPVCGETLDKAHLPESPPEASRKEGGPQFSASADTERSEDWRQALYTFVDRNADYYYSKWHRSHQPGVQASWNWAAFFLSIFWLGSRKMYKQLLIFLGVLLLLDIIELLMDGGGALFNTAATLALYVLIGIYGNALYYRFAKKRVAAITAVTESPEAERHLLRFKGGRSTGGVFAAIGLAIVYGVFSLILYGGAEPGNAGPNAIKFGRGVGPNDLTEVATVFEPGEKIYFNTSFDEPIKSGQFKIVILKKSGADEVLYTERNQKIDPAWEGVKGNLYDPSLDGYTFEPGNYIVRIYNKGVVVSEGTFTVAAETPKSL